ncbi:hypothetical protein M409DRAFT_29059 [Zasmidium cellare ATCC 36951]|uniref:Class II aldolase/adducin N-terminal domain-containing protein n=1 Tax=Zasmidium cellare ATCC 36951 TaxID=1080233 RepID=A0A6A6C0E1_ZASCE|nr:uncharacterized protein M409DRAFT_29059 [Zasmidium cellare ATCC 36951]KAF2160435.1 hypothetical protein M409DRAFT_29059 [Zasmidium cellare ATCC 36951]
MANLNAPLRDSLSRLITANHILDHHGLVDAFGHISLRDPEDPSKFYMTGQQSPAFIANETDLAHYNISDGSPMKSVDRESGAQPCSERFCHSGIMKRFPGVNAVVYSPSPVVLAVGVSGVGLRPVVHMAGFLGKKVPVFDIGDVYDELEASSSLSMQRNMLVNSNDLGDGLARYSSKSSHSGDAALPDYTVLLQRGHGFYTWGETVEEAVYRAIYTQQNAKIQMSATDFSVVASGELKIQFLDEQEAKDCAVMNKASAVKAWMYWRRLVESNPTYRNDLTNKLITAGTYRKTHTNRMEPF